jgi:hypothetical protein
MSNIFSVLKMCFSQAPWDFSLLFSHVKLLCIKIDSTMTHVKECLNKILSCLYFKAFRSEMSEMFDVNAASN